MTIKELEERVGLTRANIRFYEQEGLLSPARLENGYRDYSEADADTLRKIKLLRQLHFDLNAIRALQKGEQDLTAALAAQLTELEHDRQALERVQEVCRAMRGSGATFSSLDPKPWLEELERKPVPQTTRFSPAKDTRLPDSVCHPWVRFFAREIDLSLYSLLWSAVWMLLLRWDLNEIFIGQLFSSYVCFGLMLLVEPLLLHFFGTTPGKLIFGIRVRDVNGEKLTYNAAFNRTLGVFGRGMGYGIPLYSWWRYWKSYKSCADEERCPWEGEERYSVSDPEGVNIGLCVLFFVLDFILAFNLARWSMLPPNRGSLTTAEYFENVNFYMDELDMSVYNRPDENGVWVDNTPSNMLVVDFSEEDYTYDVTLTDGFVTGVTLTYTVSSDQILDWSSTQAEVSLLALAAAQKSFDVKEMDDWAAEVWRESWYYDVIRDNVHIVQTTKLENVDHFALSNSTRMPFTRYLPAVEGELATLTQTVCITLEATP